MKNERNEMLNIIRPHEILYAKTSGFIIDNLCEYLVNCFYDTDGSKIYELNDDLVELCNRISGKKVNLNVEIFPRNPNTSLDNIDYEGNVNIAFTEEEDGNLIIPPECIKFED